ncbi:MAG: hypothetical protein Q9165_008147 [Trypethelium subeluteriae]
MGPNYLILGASGGLGTGVLSHLQANSPPGTTITAASTREAARADFTARGIPFVHTDYESPTQLATAFTGVQNLLFISARTYDNAQRIRWHRNIISAAQAAGVGHIYYTSLAFGGHGSESRMDIQAAHYATEQMLAESGVRYTSIREGVYADSFPLFLNWHPGDRKVWIPVDGPVAYAWRAELAEATARILLLGPGEVAKLDGEKGAKRSNLVLLTGPRTCTLEELTEAVREATGEGLEVERMPIEEFVEGIGENDTVGGREIYSKEFYRKKVSWYEGIAKGDGEMVDPLMEKLLGRRPLDGVEAVKRILMEDRNYKGHMDYAK